MKPEEGTVKTGEFTYDELRALCRRPEPASQDELAAVHRLVSIAMRDTGQSKRVADFLLAWWNATTCGGFDLTDLWAVDQEIADDMLVVLGLVARVREYPPAHDPSLKEAFRRLIEIWRPELLG